MGDFILATGDQAIFLPAFGAATVTVAPGVLAGTGKTNIIKKPVCVDGDEKKVMVPGCAYITASHSIPGVGMLSIESLAGDQKGKKVKSGGKAVLLKGGQFHAKFQVVTPAQMPAPPGPPVLDATPSYSGKGNFVTTNAKVKGS